MPVCVNAGVNRQSSPIANLSIISPALRRGVIAMSCGPLLRCVVKADLLQFEERGGGSGN
jgi:hypothetical protein